ncbi:MAG: hypothetical protein WCG55_04360 [bacterium]
MSLITDIQKIKNPTFVLAVIALLLLVTPGFLFVFYFNRPLFEQLEFLKLLFLSLGCMTPLVAFHFFTAPSMHEEGSNTSNENFTSLIFSILISSAAMYLSLFAAYCFGESLHYGHGLRIFIGTLVTIEVGFFWGRSL